MAELYATDIPGFTNFMRMTPEFFEMMKTRLEPRLARQATNYRAPISVGEKLALTIRYLATGESYTSLYPRREAGILWIHHRCRPRPRPQRFLVSDLQSTFLSGFLSYLAGGLIW